MNILKRFINWIREYRTEEARQTRLFNREFSKIHQEEAMLELVDAETARNYNALGKVAELFKKYPLSKSAQRAKQSGPMYLSQEEWDAIPIRWHHK